jgi:phenylacetate-coenzyme A ligase PaaK-like adenylate-forming protein
MYEDFLEISPFSVEKHEKKKLLSKELIFLSKEHYGKCREYKAMMDFVGCDFERMVSYEEIPFLPVGLFKEMELRSVEKEEIFKTMTSSGTTGQAVSKIYLDRETASRQQKTLVKIVSEFTGKARMPMLIIDCPSVVKNRAMFSARGAGILGFSIFGTKKVYALTDDMQINWEAVKEFLKEHEGEPILLFGFTFMIWQHFYKELLRKKEETGEILDLSKGILIHGGGWKKLISEAVSPAEFKQRLEEVCGLKRVHDYYGMVEQTGCIYMECECGHLHASIFSDVMMRRAEDFSVCDIGEKGMIQVLSIIPHSYPGHSLLTEDEGILLGEDDCPCGRKGKYFKVLGRIKNAEIRGCSDTYAADFVKG